MANDVKERMIGSAMYVLAREGYQGASFSAVLAHSGAPRGSIYYHFPGGKDEMIAAAVDATLRREVDALERHRGKSLTALLRAMSAHWRGHLERSECRSGCPAVATSIGASDEQLLDHVAQVFAQWRAHYRTLLEDSGVPKGQSSEMATMLLAGFEGAMHLARAERSLEVFDDASRSLRRNASKLVTP